MNVSIRKFEKIDIPNKIKWINDALNNRYLHYDLPLDLEKTQDWFEKIKDSTDRYDGVIEVDGSPVGLIGLLSIDSNNKKAEYYIMLGERSYLGKGVAARASQILLKTAFNQIDLNRIYLYTEIDNRAAVKSCEGIGFKREGVLRKDILSKGRFVDRYLYGMTRDDFNGSLQTPIYKVNEVLGNALYIKREDFIPVSFGGNKARKGRLFFEKIDRGNYDCVVTYGSGSSNHCRIIANMAAVRNMKCYIISPEEAREETCNRKMMEILGAEITVCPVSKVHGTIENKIRLLTEMGCHPYFIAGGGHGTIGTQAYVDCYEEIRQYEKEHKVYFDYVFHASGTGTTQAGLVCGQLISREDRKIIGISIARKNPSGRNIVLSSIKEYLDEHRVDVSDEDMEKATVFIDQYIDGGYGKKSNEIDNVIHSVLKQYQIPLDSVYTAKAFFGMTEYLKDKDIQNKNILFIHTGGTPLFFDYLNQKG